MATETSVNTYTGVEGVLNFGGNPFAYVKADVAIDRNAVNIARGGKWSDIALPGKVKPKIKITYGLVDSDLLIDALDDGTNTTSSIDEALHAGVAGNGAQLVTTISTQPSVPMSIKIKIVSTDGFAASAIQFIGTDNNDLPITETIQIPLVATGSTTTYLYGHQRFKTVNTMVMPAALSANDTVTPYGMGQRTVTLGKPLLFTFVAKLSKSATQYTQITCTNCWLKNYSMPLGNADDAAIIDQDIEIRDPDSDVTLVVNST